jgi:hypothetical protein
MGFFGQEIASKKDIPNLGEIEDSLRHFLTSDKQIAMSKYYDFYFAVEARMALFEKAYQEADTPSKQKVVIRQFNRYFQAWKACLNEINPKKIDSHIKHYHDSRYYQPIGCFDYHHPSAKQIGISAAFIGLSVLGVLGGIFVMPYCLPVGIAMIALFSIAIASALAILASSNYLEEVPFKEKETQLFEDGVQIVNEILGRGTVYGNEEHLSFTR